MSLQELLAQIETARYEDPLKTIELIHLALPISRENLHKPSEILLLAYLGWAHANLYEYDKANEHFTLSLSLAKESGDIANEIYNLRGLGNAHRWKSEYESALEYIHTASELAKQTHDNFKIRTGYHDLAIIHYDLQNFEESIRYCNLALELDPADAFVRDLLAGVHWQLGEHEIALQINSGLEHDPVLSLPIYSSGLKLRKATYLLELERCEEARPIFESLLRGSKDYEFIYSALGLARIEAKSLRYDEASELLQGAIPVAQALSFESDELHLRLHVAEISTLQGRFEIAETELKLVRDRFEALSSHWHEEFYRFSSALCKATGRYKNALILLEKAEQTKQSVIRETVRQKLRGAHILIDLERKNSKVEKEQLRAAHLESQLTQTTLQLLAQTELLSNFRNEISEIVRKMHSVDPLIQQLKEKLKELPCESINWEQYDAQFQAAHPDFAKKLVEKYPELTATELRVCSLVRMNLRSDEIARLFCLSERTIESHRFWIRKKMGLAKGEDLAVALAKL